MNEKIKGSTKLYAVIGDPINHSLSPQLHNTVFDYDNKDCLYIPFKIKYEDLGQSIPILKNNLWGFNVTKPHKQNILKYLDIISDEAKAYNAVNTVLVKDNKLIGHNTDGYGFAKSIESIDIKDKKVLLIGAGGAASVVLYELLKKGAIVYVKNRHKEKASNMIDNILFYSENKRAYHWNNEYCYMIINSTPLGMGEYKDKLPIEENYIKKSEIAYDLIYNPYETKFLALAKANKCEIVNGFEMLFHQGIRAQEIWKNNLIHEETINKVHKEVSNYFENKFR